MIGPDSCTKRRSHRYRPRAHGLQRKPKAAGIRRKLVLVCAVLSMASSASTAIGDDEQERIKIAREFAQNLVDRRFQEATRPFDKTMTEALPAEKLKLIWRDQDQRLGGFKSLGRPWTGKVLRYDVVYLPAEFGAASLNLKLVFDAENRITGFFFDPGGKQKQETASYKPPAYDRPEEYIEKEIELGAPGWRLPGKLTLPKKEKPVPVVVLVHGSGPQDADETIGPNKPFRDLAGGLGSQGIAVLRYDKRTFAHRMKLAARKTITVREEVIDDALAALEIARQEPAIDKTKVFLLGHSMGATLAPHIAKEDGNVAGVILLAASARDAMEVVEEQLRYIASLPGPNQQQNAKLHKEIKTTIAEYRAGKIGENAPILNVPISYWKEISRYDVTSPGIAAKLGCRVLILGGGRDYQVTREDFDLYRTAVGKKKGVTFKWMADMNHLFIRGEKKATPEEYAETGNVGEEVIGIIANWIEKYPSAESRNAAQATGD